MNEGQQQRQQTAAAAGTFVVFEMQAVTKARGRAGEWFCVSNLACTVPASGLSCLFAGAPKSLEGLLEELLAALDCAERDGSRI